MYYHLQAVPPAIFLVTKGEVIRGSSDLSLLQMTIFVGSTQQKGGQIDLYLLEGGFYMYMKLCLLISFVGDLSTYSLWGIVCCKVIKTKCL